jgi:hypothetical protein
MTPNGTDQSIGLTRVDPFGESTGSDATNAISPEMAAGQGWILHFCVCEYNMYIVIYISIYMCVYLYVYIHNYTYISYMPSYTYQTSQGFSPFGRSNPW